MSVPGDFIRRVEQTINKKHDLQKGDREAWAEWFDELEMLANFCGSMADAVDIDLNAHDDLVAALERYTKGEFSDDLQEMARAALARARGEK